jgi:hypothetical protein
LRKMLEFQLVHVKTCRRMLKIQESVFHGNHPVNQGGGT